MVARIRYAMATEEDSDAAWRLPQELLSRSCVGGGCWYALVLIVLMVVARLLVLVVRFGLRVHLVWLGVGLRWLLAWGAGVDCWC